MLPLVDEVFVVIAVLVCYALEKRSRWFILALAASCARASAYGFLQGVRGRLEW